MIFRSIGLFGRYQDAAVKSTLNEIREHLEQRGRAVLLGDTTHQEIQGLRIGDNGQPLAESIDLGVVVGGDGTMLHVASALAQVDLPVIGINMGRLGFLTDIPAEDFRAEIDLLLADNTIDIIFERGSFGLHATRFGYLMTGRVPKCCSRCFHNGSFRKAGSKS